jgi:Cu/Ag efflux protein CusF
MSNRIKGSIAAFAFLCFVAVPLAARAQSADAPPAGAGQAAQAQTASGELVKVDVAAKTLTLKASDREMQFSFDDQTKITGASSAAGLATMEGSQATVRYTAKGAQQLATEIRITPKKDSGAPKSPDR